MAQLCLENVTFEYGASATSSQAVCDVSFVANAGEVTALTGASGSGKSTILKLIAGFLKPKEGTITIDDQLVSSPNIHVPPQNRGIGLVFQHHTLLPHLTISQNVGFGYLGPRRERADRVAQLLVDFRCAHLASRYPHEISGGEAQRVALARAMAADPALFIMDEPFSSIDTVMRRELRAECMQILHNKKVTVLIVTHEAEEAMELADQLVVIDHGRTLQMGTPRDVYYSPHEKQVAELFGEINHIQDAKFISELTGKAHDEVLLRPESITLSDHGNGVPGNIIFIQYRGNYDLLSVVVAGKRCLKVKAYHHNHKIGDRIYIKAAI